MKKKGKYTDSAYVETEFVSNEDEIKPVVKKSVKKDPLADKVKNLRGKGYDNDRIAAMLMTRKEIVDKIK